MEDLHIVEQYCKDTANALITLQRHGFHTQMLVILYSAIDTLSSVASDDGRSSRETFMQWVEDYFDLEALKLSSIDLYSARCGILHNHRVESDLTNKKKAKVVKYVLGDEEEINSLPIEENSVNLSVLALYSSFSSGGKKYLKDIKIGDVQLNSDAVRKIMFARMAQKI